MAEQKTTGLPPDNLELEAIVSAEPARLLEVSKVPWLGQKGLARMIALSIVVSGMAGLMNSVDTIVSFFKKPTDHSIQRLANSPTLLSQSEEDCVRSDRTCRVELWIQNPTDQPLAITGLRLRVMTVDSEPILGMLEPSGEYPIDLTGLSRAGISKSFTLRQEIAPAKGEIFVLSFGARDLVDKFRTWRLQAELETSAGVMPIRQLWVHLPWDRTYSASPPVELPN
jgi:hypothetical protein